MKKALNPNEILKEVNKFDKEFGVKLKHSEVWLEPSNYKETYNARCEIEIAQKIWTCIFTKTAADYAEKTARKTELE